MNVLLALLVNISAIAILILGMYKHYVISKGAVYLRRFYWLNIITGVLNLLVNGLMVIRDPAIWGILSFQIVLVWAIAMSIKGLIYGDVSSRKHLQ